MATATNSSLSNWNRKSKEEIRIEFRKSDTDYSKIIVKAIRPDGKKQIIGYIYTLVDEENTTWYVATNLDGRVEFPATTHFSTVEEKFERYAHLLALRRKMHQHLNNDYSLTKNSNIMTQTTQT